MMITKTIQRRLESLEREERSRKQQERRSLDDACIYSCEIVLAYYVGGLVSNDEKDICNEEGAVYHQDERYDEDEINWISGKPLSHEGTCKHLSMAMARVLKCSSSTDYDDLILKGDGLAQRYRDAYRRLFVKVGLDFDTAARDVLFDAFVKMVNQLPSHWLDWLRSNLSYSCPPLHIPAGSNLPRELNSGNFLLFA
jgi:hypothetical protein